MGVVALMLAGAGGITGLRLYPVAKPVEAIALTGDVGAGA